MDQVAAAVLEEAGEELEVFEAATIGVAGGGLGEGGLEGFVALNAAFGEGGFVFEEEGVEDILGAVVEDAAGGADGLMLDGFAQFFLQAGLHVQGAEGAVMGLGEDVLDGGLVLQDHEGDDVAAGTGVGSGVEETGQAEDVGPLLDGHVAGVVGIFDGDDVAAMMAVAMGAGDIPAAPAVAKGGGAVHDGAALAEDGVAAGAGEDGAHEEAGHTGGEGAAVAVHAGLIAVKLERFVRGGLGLDEVEDGAEIRVHGGDFDGPAEGVADVGFIAEVDDTRGLGADAAVLGAGLGKDEHLGLQRDVEVTAEVFEDRPGIGPVDSGCAGPDFLDQGLHGIARLGGGVTDGRQFILLLRHGEHGQQEKEGKQTHDRDGGALFKCMWNATLNQRTRRDRS